MPYFKRAEFWHRTGCHVDLLALLVKWQGAGFAARALRNPLVLLVPLEQLVSCTARSPDGGPDRCTFLALGHRSDPGAGTRGSTDDDRALFPRAGIIRVVDFDGVDGRLRHVHFRLGGRRCKSDDRRVSSRRGVRDDVGSSLVLDFDAADFERRRSVHVGGAPEVAHDPRRNRPDAEGEPIRARSRARKRLAQDERPSPTRSSRAQVRGRKFLLSKHLVFSSSVSFHSFYP